MKKEVILDSNIFIRFLVGDIKDQFTKSMTFFKGIEEGKAKGYVSILVINEVIWILENYYEFKRVLYFPQLMKILSLKSLKIIEIKKKMLFSILERMQSTSIDFTDIYLVYNKENKEILSFDKDFQKIISN